MTLDIDSFKKHLTGLVEQSTSPCSFPAADNTADTPHFIIAYSGGLDSHVLLHLMKQTEFSCTAVYIDHGLQQQSAQWALHCEQVCQQLAIDYKTVHTDARPARGESPEASARGARYKALAKLMNKGDILLTAQHQQDQSETLMLQMLRTAGPAGLSAMPEYKLFAAGRHLRPLLQASQAELEEYAHLHQLQWIEDPSNQDQSFDRNFLRHSVFPLLQQRWPSIHKTLSNVSGLQAEANELMNDLAEQDAETVLENDKVIIEQLLSLSRARQRNLIRFWLQQCQLDIPTAKRMDEIIGTMLTAADDKSPVVSWQHTEVRRFQGRLYAFRIFSAFDTTKPIELNKARQIRVPGLDKELYFEQATTGLSSQVLDRSLSVRFRQGGEKIKPAGRTHTMALKKLMQQAEIPPWLRPRIPLLYLDDKLIAVADYWVADAYKNQPDQPGWLLKTRYL